MIKKINNTILVSPLDWGLGHATRCVPLIKHLLFIKCNVIIACNETQEKLLKKELPSVTFVNLPGYNIKYSTSKRLLPVTILLQLPKILTAIRNEHNWLTNYLKVNPIDAIISDNRYGFYHSSVKSIFITHQLRVIAPVNFVEKIIQIINYSFIKKFNECWVPDEKGKINLAGRLSHPTRLPKVPVFYIGGISRLQKGASIKIKYDVLVLISGPEPQRSIFEKKILEQLKFFSGTTLLVRGLPATDVELQGTNNLWIKNHLPAKELEDVINESGLVISRSGYTTVMDLMKLKKKAILVPTPGQTEQEYLADHLFKQGWAFTADQEDLDLKRMLHEAKNFNYKFPDLEMELYKDKLTSFINNLFDQ